MRTRLPNFVELPISLIDTKLEELGLEDIEEDGVAYIAVDSILAYIPIVNEGRTVVQLWLSGGHMLMCNCSIQEFTKIYMKSIEDLRANK